MKSRTELKREIKSLRVELSKTEDKRTGKRITREIDFLKSCLYYLETNPSKDFIQQQLEIVEKKLDMISKGFSSWVYNQPGGRRKLSIYNSEMGATKLAAQKKTLDFILH